MSRKLLRWVVMVLGTTVLFPASAGEVEGRLQWARRVELGTPLSGVVVEVAVEPGERVTTGQLLLRLEERTLRSAVSQTDAEVRRAESRFGEAEREKERAEELYERTVLSDHELQQARIAFDEAAAERAEARHRQAEARLALEYASLKSPFEAWVVERRVEAGETVVGRLEARPLLVLAEAGRMVARAELGAEAVQRLAVGSVAEVRSDGRSYRGRIRMVGLEPAASGRYPVEVEFETDTLLRPGQPVTLALP